VLRTLVLCGTDKFLFSGKGCYTGWPSFHAVKTLSLIYQPSNFVMLMMPLLVMIGSICYFAINLHMAIILGGWSCFCFSSHSSFQPSRLCFLGGFIGPLSTLVSEKIQKWVPPVCNLSEIAVSQPHIGSLCRSLQIYLQHVVLSLHFF